MKSPKFTFSVESIKKCVSPAIISSLWKSKIRAQLRKQIVWDVIEYRDIDNNLKDFSEGISKLVTTASYRVERPHNYLVEKSRGLCRQMVLISPRELVLLQCLSSALHKQIVAKSPSKAAFFQPGDMKWSEGKMTLGEGEYGSVASWKKFQKQVLKFRKENRFVVVTDVANFYDFINFRHLRNIISSLCEVDESILDLLLHLLSELAWTPDYMPRQDIGMPQIEAEAPRVLANAMLFELDKVAEQYAYKNYARFMDDIDCGVMTIVEAKKFVRDVDLTLQSRQLRLNSAKTKILSQQDAFDHFCVSENSKLDEYTPLVDLAQTFVSIKPFVGGQLLKLYEGWLKRDASGAPDKDSVLRQGNGPKVHKRVLNLLKRCEIEVPVEDLLWLIRNDPGMRQVAFRLLTSYKKANATLYKLVPILKRDFFVDDAAYVDFAYFCVYANFKLTAKLSKTLREAAALLNKRGLFGIYSATMILARLADANELLAQSKIILRDHSDSVWLCRTAAGLFPFFQSAPGVIQAEFLQIVRMNKHQAVLDVLDHHLKLANDKTFVSSNYSYLSHPNESYPQAMYFPKAMQILSVKYNSASASQYKRLVARHSALKSDPFFKAWGF